MSNADYTANVYIPIAWELFHRDTRALAHKLVEADLGTIKGIIAITRGGLIPASILARELDVRLIDTVGVVTYDDRVRGEPRVVKTPDAMVGDGEGWLIVDDLVDSGVTARVVKQLLPKAHLATVYAKPAGQNEAHTFSVAVKQDVWLLFPWDAELKPNEPLARQGRNPK
jgi:xanthine phosphoribosyltransferase